jgi:5-oxoprolinase (ATP-hydrolysing)
MYHIRANAENSVRNLLRDVAKRAGTNVLNAVDYLDDGTPVSSAFAENYVFKNDAIFKRFS